MGSVRAKRWYGLVQMAVGLLLLFLVFLRPDLDWAMLALAVAAIVLSVLGYWLFDRTPPSTP